MNENSGYELLEKYSKLVGKYSIKNELEEYYNSLCTRAKPNMTYWDTTGFPSLDQYITKMNDCGGKLITICARPSIGKSAFTVSVIRNMLVRDNRILFFSLQMSAKDLINRLVASISQVSLYNVGNGRLSNSEFYRVEKAIEYLWTRDLYIVDIRSISVQALRAIILATAKIEMESLECILIDHFGLISGKSSPSDKYESPSSVLQSLASYLNIPVIAMFQLQRPNNQIEPSLSDIPCEMNFTLVHDSDVVLFLHRHKSLTGVGQCIIGSEGYAKPLQVAKVIIAKNENGDTGHIFVGFNGRTASFENIE